MKERLDPDNARLLRTAAWMWLGYLIAMLFLDRWLYQRLSPLVAFYFANGCAALLFLVLAYWNDLGVRLGSLYLPLMLLLLSALPLIGNHLLLPRLPPGPLSNAEGMALRQLPVLFLALVLTAWQYRLAGVMVFSGATALLELLTVTLIVPLMISLTTPPPGLAQPFAPVPIRAINVFLILAIVRTISFIAVGVFVSQLIERLNQQQKSLQEANLQLRHYASTLESLAVSRERNRLAHELHDTLAHSLTAISVQLETARAYWNKDRLKARQLLEQSLAATRTGLEETRRALKALRASPLEELGLLLALRQLAESAAARFGLELELDLRDPPPALSPDVEQTIYRVAQEAIENAVKHAGAKTLSLHLSHNGQTTLIVADDGIGFEVKSSTSGGHFGLAGMRERAALVGGRLSVESQPGKGTRVVLTI